MNFIDSMNDDQQVAMLIESQLFELDKGNHARQKPETENCGVSLVCGNDEYTSTCFYNCVLAFLKEDVNISAHTLPLKELLPVGEKQIMMFVELRGVTVEVFEATYASPWVYKPSDWKGDTVIKLWLEHGHYTLIRDLNYT